MKKYIPNVITLIRGSLIIPIFIFSLLNYKYIAGILFLIAAITDFLDGFLARTWHVESDFGRKADPVIDKYLSIAVLFTISINYPINMYLFFTETMIMLTNWCMYKTDKNIKPIQIGRIKTVFLFSYITFVLFGYFYLSLFYFIIIFELIVLTSYVTKLVMTTKKTQ